MRKPDKEYSKHPGQAPVIVQKMTDEEIFTLGLNHFNAAEDDVILSLAVKPKSLKSVKANHRWRRFYDQGRAKGYIQYNTLLANSKDATIQKEIAKMTLPPVEFIEEGFEFIIDAPEWFKKGIGGRKKGRPKTEET